MYHSLEPGYIEKCAASLKASLTPSVGEEIASEQQLDAFLATAATELSAALVDGHLLEMVLNVVISCNKDLYNRLESNIKLGTDSRQIYDVPNGGQILNTRIANLIHHHEHSVRRLVRDLGSGREKSFSSLIDSLKVGQNLVMAILQQLLDAIMSSVGDILISVHREPGLNTNQTNAPSLYMKELQDFLARVWSSHIQPFNDRQLIGECGKTVAARSIELFIRNAAILRPLTNIGRNKLKCDGQHIETVLKVVVADLTTIGKSFRTLRASQTLITKNVDELAAQSLEPDSPVPPYIVLLLMFGYAGNDLLSPHTTAGWSNDKLIQWLDGHTSDRERFELISGALLKYRNDIRKRNLSQYDPVYPLISATLEKAHNARE